MSITKEQGLAMGGTIQGEPRPVASDGSGGKYRVSAKSKRTHNGVTYASKKEMNRAIYWEQMKAAGNILCWIPQVSFRLPYGQRYVCDFLIIGTDHKARWEDVKGYRHGTAYSVFKLKRTLVREHYGIIIEEV